MMMRACETCHARKVKCDLSFPIRGRSAQCSNCLTKGLDCRPHFRKSKGRPRRRNEEDLDVLASQAHIPAGNLSQPDNHAQSIPIQPASTNSTPISIPSHPGVQTGFSARSGYITSNDLAIDEDDAMQYEPQPSNATGSLSEIQTSMFRTAANICLPPQPVKLSLLRSFIEKGLPWMPIVVPQDLEQMSYTSPASLLLLSALVAGSKLSSAPNALEWGEKCYFLAKSLIMHGTGHNTLHLITATVLLHWWNPSGPEHVSLDCSSLWLRIGTGLAHQCGLHRESEPTVPDAQLRRRLWWTLVARDNQIATSHGRPRALRVADSNVKPLHVADFDSINELDSLRFIHFVRITAILGDITERYRRGTLSELHSLRIETELTRWLDELPPTLCLYDRTTRTLKLYDFKARQLHVPFLVALIIFYRSDTPGQQFSLTSLVAASSVMGIFEEYIAWGDIHFLAPASIFYLLVASLVQITSYRYALLTQRSDSDISTIRTAFQELRKRFPTANGAERIFENLLKRSCSKETTHQRFSKSLSPTQSHLLLASGPDLCPAWPLAFGNPTSATESLIDNINMGVTNDHRDAQPETLNAAGEHPRQEIQVPVEQVDDDLSLLQPVDDFGEFTFGGLDFWWSR